MLATVDGYDDEHPVVSYRGGEFRAKLEYARVLTGPCSTRYPKMLRTARRMLPVGSRVWVVRSRPSDPDTDTVGGEVVSLLAAFVHPFRGERRPPRDKPSINGALVATTVAMPWPYPSGRVLRTDDVPRAATRDMSTQDLQYWLRFVNVYRQNWRHRVSEVGDCRRAREADARQRRHDRLSYASSGRRTTGGGGG